MRGYSLIECIVGITIAGLLSVLIARSTQLLSSQLSQITLSIEQRLATIKSVSLIAIGLSALEKTRQSELLVVVNGSNLRLPHGGPHPLIGISSSSKPRSHSDILSVIELDPWYQGRVVESQVTSREIQITVCGTASRPSPERFKSHILLGIGGVCQVTGIPQAGPSGCFTLTGSATRGLVHPSPNCARGSFHEYIPVSREYSLFVDRNGEFRLASHVGMRILENQPISRGLREVTIRWLATEHDTRFAKVSVRGSLSSPLRFLFPTSLRSTPIWNEFLL